MACGGGDGGTDTDAPAGDDTVDTDPYAGLPEPAAPGAYSAGECPAMDGVVSDFRSGRYSRTFRVHLPRETDGAGVLFLWHGNGDSAEGFDRYMDGEGLARELGVITVIPDAGAGGLGLDWSVPPNDTKGDAGFFDDMLACLSAQYPLDLRRVYSAGFSAGALWTSWLAMNRADHLAAAVTFSGGSDGGAMGIAVVNGYKTPAWDIPVLMTEGGPSDQVIVNFEDMTESMSTQLREDGSTVVVCSHGEGHTPPSGFDRWAWDFLDAHVYGRLPSPYAGGADPSGKLPGYCAGE
jgi:hypothetical protein